MDRKLERMAAALATVALATGSFAGTAAAANERAVCIGEFISGIASSTRGPVAGTFVSGNATAWSGIGSVVGEEARNDVCGG